MPRVIVVLFLLMMLCVWPFCLVRRGTSLSSNYDKEYIYTEYYLTKDVAFTQTFVAQSSRLNSIEFVVEFQEPLPADGALLFTLYDAHGDTVVSQKLDSDQIMNSSFSQVKVGKWMKKGAEYSFTLTVTEEWEGLIRGVYTQAQEPCGVGNQDLSMGEEWLAGYALTRYEYGMPLNSKNVLCIWAFLAVCCLLTLNMVGATGALAGTNGRAEKTVGDFCRKTSQTADKVWAFVNRYQALVLVLEMAVILLMSANLCRVRTVDWDEAYTIQMITKYSFGEMIQVTAQDIHPPLYYLLVRLFSIVLGTSVFALKMVSVFFTGCVMLLGITKVRRYWGLETAFLFNLVIGLGPQFLFYAQNIRMYSLSLLCITYCGLLAYEILRGGGERVPGFYLCCGPWAVLIPIILM